MPWDINEAMSSAVGPDDFNIKEPEKKLDLAKTEFTYHEPAKPDTSSSIMAPAFRLFATFVTLGFSESVHKAVKKTLVATLSSFLTAEFVTKDQREKFIQIFDPANTTRLSVNVGTKAVLDGMLIKPKEESQKYVIMLNGLGEVYEANLFDAREYANEADVNILMFNYRGTGDSTASGPTRPKDLVADTLAMIAFLKEEGVNPEDIVIHGHSLGGGVGAAAAMQTPGTRLINDRSFSTFSKATSEMVTVVLRAKVGETAARVIGELAGALVKGAGLDLNTGKIYRAGLKDTLVLHHPEDPMINKSSLKKSLDKHEITQGNSSHRFVELDARSINTEDIHDTSFREFAGTAAKVKEFIHNITKPEVPEEEFDSLDKTPEEAFLNFKPKVTSSPKEAEPSPWDEFLQELTDYENFLKEFDKPAETKLERFVDGMVQEERNNPPTNP